MSGAVLAQKPCPRCGLSYAKVPKISWAQWAEKIYCSRTCAKGIPVEGRISARVEHRQGSECHWWTGPVCKDGYGRISIARRRTRKEYRAHRIVYELNYGPIPAGLLVLHSCDNPSCVNPAHLRVGTPADNMADKMLRGRHRNGYGACYAR